MLCLICRVRQAYRVSLASQASMGCQAWKVSLLFVCMGLTSLLNIWGHIAMVPACSSGTLTNVLPHRNAMLQTQDMTPHPVTVYRHGADLMWNITVEYAATHFNVFGQTRSGNLSTHTSERSNSMMLIWWYGSPVESIVPTGSWTLDLWCVNLLHYLLAHSCFLIKCKS